MKRYLTFIPRWLSDLNKLNIHVYMTSHIIPPSRNCIIIFFKLHSIINLTCVIVLGLWPSALSLLLLLLFSSSFWFCINSLGWVLVSCDPYLCLPSALFVFPSVVKHSVSFLFCFVGLCPVMPSGIIDHVTLASRAKHRDTSAAVCCLFGYARPNCSFKQSVELNRLRFFF